MSDAMKKAPIVIGYWANKLFVSTFLIVGWYWKYKIILLYNTNEKRICDKLI